LKQETSGRKRRRGANEIEKYDSAPGRSVSGGRSKSAPSAQAGGEAVSERKHVLSVESVCSVVKGVALGRRF
jgi:hypothetical protein